MLFFSQCDIFSQLLHNWHYTNVYSISATYTYSTVYNYSPMYTGFAVYICFPFQHVIFFLNYCIITLQQCLQHILNICIQYCLQLHYPVDRLCCLHMLPFHNMIFFHNYCPIDSTTMSTAYPQHIHTVFVYNYTTQYTVCAFTYASFSQCDIFSQSLHNWHYNNVYSISLTYTYSTVYNYTTQYTVCAFYICFLYTMWYFFTITAQLTLQQCLQHILNIYIQYCLQLHYPVDWLCCLHMLPFHNMIFFNNYCPIDSTTMFTAYTQYIHTVLFTITQPSILYVLLHMLPFHNVIFFHNHCTIDNTTMSIAYP